MIDGDTVTAVIIGLLIMVFELFAIYVCKNIVTAMFRSMLGLKPRADEDEQ